MTETPDLISSPPKPRRHIPIAYKLALVFTMLIATGMLALGIVIARDQTQLIERQSDEYGQTLSMQVAETAKDPLLINDPLTLQAISNNLVMQNSVAGAALFTDEFAVASESGVAVSLERLQDIKDGQRVIKWQFTSADEVLDVTSFVSPIVTRGITVGYSVVTLNRDLVEQARMQTVQTVVGATLLLVVIAIGVSIVLAERITRPIYQLMSASRAISQGNYQFRLNEKRNDEIGALTHSLNRMADGLVRKEQVERAFSRYVSPKVAHKILNELQEVQLGGQHVDASVLFADISGFTSLSEQLSPQEISTLLNEYFSHIAQAAHTYHGYIDKFIGDCVMIVFGVPEPDQEHHFHAVACAVLIKNVVDVLNHLRLRQNLPTVQFKVGINSGSMLAGNMGSNDRMEYTVVGDAVNLASRLSSVAGPGEIIVSRDIHDKLVGDDSIVFRQHDTMFIRGKKDPVTSYLVLELAERYRATNDRALRQIFKTRMRAI